MRLVTFNSFVLSHATGNDQLRCVSGIASAHRSHVKQFLDVAAYDDYYNIVVDTGEIGVDQFASKYSPCWCNISQLTTVMIPPTGVRDSGRAIVVDIVLFIAGMLAATTIWTWK
jgi:hypothetical protein